ncbi:hypothetical protein [Maribacter sp. LLG6340-A2]|uniref:hypothetical protein n=1 Tax=Maribacter sp. LLG6340-A2 TaxID=3160834 RepID=UPI003869706D
MNKLLNNIPFKKTFTLAFISMVCFNFLSCDKDDIDHSIIGIWENKSESSGDENFKMTQTNTLEYTSNGALIVINETITSYENQMILDTTVSSYLGTYSINKDVVTEIYEKEITTINGETISEKVLNDKINKTFKIENNILTLKFADVTGNITQSGSTFYRK